ncbi:Macrolide export ATP-binding/permease protein MacB [Symmachiella dynata]|uniref:Macrolide export ATP-binding/permease protein MacB n=1 Tax=Symmachiella dynata TaxID=2527995 RepID=A0A517ZH65_9PLAN|nr:Macrolide export ATP-binding/permease protein MacB [Symmachiella dynata]
MYFKDKTSSVTDHVILSRGIEKTYRSGAIKTTVLHGIDLEVMRGECVFLVGPSGSGKTTLLSILGCILSPDSGTLQILDQDVSRLNAKQQARFRRENIGFVFQRFHLFDGLRAWENVKVALDLLGYPSRLAQSESRRLLDLVGLSDRADHRSTQLSMGQRQRVALARALAGDPDLILADEPTASLDAESGASAMKTLNTLAKSLGKTVVVVTHDSRIFSMADRILHLVDGRINESTTEQKARTTNFAGQTVSANDIR